MIVDDALGDHLIGGPQQNGDAGAEAVAQSRGRVDVELLDEHTHPRGCRFDDGTRLVAETTSGPGEKYQLEIAQVPTLRGR